MDRNTPTATVTAFTDIMCGWSTLAFHRFYRARSAAGLDGRVFLDPQLFLLEDVNATAWNSAVTEGEKPVLVALEEGLELRPWQRDPSEFPVTSLPANEAVHAAKEQSPTAAEQLDMALRMAFWRDGRCISMGHEILDVAAGCDAVDVDRLGEALDDGRARGAMMRAYRTRSERVRGSAHFFLPDGSDVHNPGIAMHEVGETGYLVVDSDDPTVYEEMLRRVATAAGLD
ncbi:DsbA family oxidoreductase [Ornithinimicrobium avium]|uniref:Dithiol-disulfide isomerase n=1 Tax=Ornithinimicrobium avium TaxID=2283195 RepID=A0A345NM90_9MICO|nr:DsbA family protein [Ornithinimicrobium avium]AXH96148.1 dithiol-disulfide isomerase [Ornithinimicrobium avium]